MQQESIQINHNNYILETGKWAKQADGSVILKWGDMVLMANATIAPDAKEGLDFFPLTVEYREKFYATGRIPGGFFKREARPTEREVLTSRLTDRPIRPLFPENYHNELQIFVTLLSADGVTPSQVHAITAASAALMITGAPFSGPVAGVQIGRINNQYILFPTIEQLAQSDINLVLAGTKTAVTMIEGFANEVSEKDMIDAVHFGHDEIKKLCILQEKFQQKAGKPLKEHAAPEDTTELRNEIAPAAQGKIKDALTAPNKQERSEKVDEAKKSIIKELEEKWKSRFEDDSELKLTLSKAKTIIDQIEVDIVRDQIFDQGLRVDGRKLDEIRDITIETNVLPKAHGSSVFTRGETQSLGVVTLATANSAQILDDVEGESKQNFFLHYNFPPFSVGEVRRYAGPGRREIGHGKLAENALRGVLPDQNKFPYVIRIVSEILESNGSSSMATVCSGSLSLMDAGVPISGAVAGIAMGLITKGDKFAVLSDIAGIEDHFGDMDFKVAGTTKGITAFQLDLKVNGISTEIMDKALSQAKEGRMHILGIMQKAIDAPRSELSPNAPRLISIRIDKERIGELIGPGGKNIKMLTEKSGAEIMIDETGMVTIASVNADAANKAKKMIELQFEEAEIDKIYEGKVKRIADFGAFIEIIPGKDGLCHISKLSDQRVEKVSDVLKEGDTVKVKVIGIDKMGKISLSIKDV